MAKLGARFGALVFLLNSLIESMGIAAPAITMNEGWLKFHAFTKLEEMQQGQKPEGFQPITHPWNNREALPLPPEPVQKIGTYWYELPKLKSGDYEIQLNQVSSAYEAWLFPRNNWERRLHFYAGKPAVNAADEVRSFRTQVIDFSIHNPTEEWLLVVNFSYSDRLAGGIWDRPKIAEGKELLLARNAHLFFLFLSIGSLSILGLYMLMIYIRRSEDRSALFLSLLCLALLLRAVGVEMLLCEIFDPTTTSLLYDLSSKIEFASIALVTLFMIPFMRSAFPKAQPVPFLDFLLALTCSGMGLLFLVVDFQTMLAIIGPMQIVTLITLAYMIYLLYQSLHRKEEGSGYMLASAMIPIVVVIFEIFHSRNGGNLRLSHFAGTCFIFMQSQVLAKRFASAFRRAEYLSASLQGEVKLQTSQIRHILDRIPEGLFRMNAMQRIDPPYSQYMETIFPESKLDSEPLLSLFKKRFHFEAQTLAMTESIFSTSFGETAVNWEMNESHLPREIGSRDDRFFEFKWYPIFEGDLLQEVIGIIRDVTDIKRLELETREQEEEFRLLHELFGAPPHILSAGLEQAWELLQACRTSLQLSADETNPRSLRYVFSLLHTFKGNARQMHLMSLASHCHEIEERYAAAVNADVLFNREEALADVDALVQRMNHVRAIYDKFFGHQRQNKWEFRVDAEDLIILKAWLDSNPEGDPQVLRVLRGLFGLNLAQSIRDMDETLAELAQSLHKAPPIMNVEWSEALTLPVEFKKALLHALGHIFRNAMDHGIELPDIRAGAGKKARGQIMVRTEFIEQQWRILIWDDGQGLLPSRIKYHAVRKGLATETSIFTFQRVAELLFTPGFSTAQSVTDISGRGIGMDAIRNLLEPMGAWIQLEPLKSDLMISTPLLDDRAIPFKVVITIP